ncbi:ankyrin repeat domain-containing protein [Agrobacterium sp. lyk4-40-TYG-31]|uniref:ankyrin repeat domain-containing protein n=1 Tax=Agrobacterium sp. lyk4-40-TYG-31 TaxID=3040276 RepID=UPI0025516A42|nr:ankyrin repeat domain-containing protein [Agrobacterium sp. lyk4-40-TYG-31]
MVLNSNMTRRRLLGTTGMLLASATWIHANSLEKQALLKLWDEWKADWRWMEKRTTDLGWKVTPLRIGPPASELQVRVLESRFGFPVPSQLRAVLTQLSGEVEFGWYVPSHLHSMERDEMPTMSFNRGDIWSLSHIEQMAIPIFLEWKKDLASQDLSEAPNKPEMWEHQFPFYNLINGDWLTIDTSDADPEKQPVRYFSHDLEMIHGLAVAPNFFTFMTQMSKLGLAGTEWASWMRFSRGQVNDTFYLDADTPGAKGWLAWIRRDTNGTEPDEPPIVVVEETVADVALLKAARANSLLGVNAALLAGAKPDCVPASQRLMEEMVWGEEFYTAISYAIRNNNTAMIERLLQVGATLNTRLLPLNVAVKEGSLTTVRWLIEHGARVNGWKNQRYWPLHDLVVTRSVVASMTLEEYHDTLRKSYSVSGSSLDSEIEKQLKWHISRADYIQMLEALLAAGADPDARWDNGLTMLAWGGDVTAKVLLAHGADPNIRDTRGATPLHFARTGEKVRLLVGAGADINALEVSPDVENSSGYTPLQSALLTQKLSGDSPITALLELGADPKRLSADGRTTLAYCFDEVSFKMISARGVDPMTLQPGRQTLLHNLTSHHWLPRQTFPNEVAFMDFLMGLGIDINARDDKGRTMLHYAAEREENEGSKPNYESVIARGADKNIADNDGKRPFDLVAGSLVDIRAVLK